MLSPDAGFECDRDGRHYVVRYVGSQVASSYAGTSLASVELDGVKVQVPATDSAGELLTHDEIIDRAIEKFDAGE